MTINPPPLVIEMDWCELLAYHELCSFTDVLVFERDLAFLASARERGKTSMDVFGVIGVIVTSVMGSLCPFCVGDDTSAIAKPTVNVAREGQVGGNDAKVLFEAEQSLAEFVDLRHRGYSRSPNIDNSETPAQI